MVIIYYSRLVIIYYSRLVSCGPTHPIIACGLWAHPPYNCLWPVGPPTQKIKKNCSLEIKNPESFDSGLIVFTGYYHAVLPDQESKDGSVNTNFPITPRSLRLVFGVSYSWRTPVSVRRLVKVLCVAFIFNLGTNSNVLKWLTPRIFE